MSFKKINRAWDMAQCVKQLPHNQKDQNMDPQTYTESQAGMAVTCHTRIRGRKLGSLGQAG